MRRRGCAYGAAPRSKPPRSKRSGHGSTGRGRRRKADPMPKVLIADKLSPAAVAIFKERGVEADVITDLKKDDLIKIVGEYEGIAVRSATKITADVIMDSKNLKFVGRAGI